MGNQNTTMKGMVQPLKDSLKETHSTNVKMVMCATSSPCLCTTEPGYLTYR